MATSPTDSRAPAGVDVIDAIYERRSVRSFRDEQVADALIQRLLAAATQAPSAMNAQPWAFVVVQDRELLQRLSDSSKQTLLAGLTPDSPMWAHREALEDPGYSVFYDAGTLIVICAAPGDWPPDEDCCLAGQNLMLAAHGLGLGTCVIGMARQALDLPELRAELGIPDDHVPVLPIIVGHPREAAAPTPREAPRVLSWKGRSDTAGR